MELVTLDNQYLLSVYRRLPLEIIKAKGLYLYDAKGKKYMDLYSGIAVNPLGHQHPHIYKALKDQMQKYLHLSNYFVSESVVNLAKILVENSFASKVFFANSGAEVNEAALKLVRKYGKMINSEKVEIISLLDSFHGRTLGSLSLTGQMSKKEVFEPLIPHIHHIKLNDIEALRSVVSPKTCAIFLELIQGEGGIKLISQDFLDEVTRLAREHQFLIVIDEIQTGLMRSGTLFCYQQFQIKPDLVTLAKSLGGGLPLGALLVSDKLESVLSYGEHGSTFGGNPLACAAGVALLKMLINNDFQAEVKEKADYLLKKLFLLKKKYPQIIYDIRGLGMMVGLDCQEFSVKIQSEALKRGILLNITNQTIIRLLPPLIITKSNINEFYKILNEILMEMSEEQC